MLVCVCSQFTAVAPGSLTERVGERSLPQVCFLAPSLEWPPLAQTLYIHCPLMSAPSLFVIGRHEGVLAVLSWEWLFTNISVHY